MKEINEEVKKERKKEIKYYVNIIIMILLILIIIIGIIYNYVFRDNTIYTSYTYINEDGYNSFTFDYPISWKVEMINQKDLNDNIYGVTLYIDKNRSEEINIITGSSTNLYYVALTDNQWVKDIRIRRKNGGYAHAVSHNYDEKLNYIIGFAADNTVVKHTTSMNISMDKEKFMKYKKQIYKIIKSVEVNQ